MAPSFVGADRRDMGLLSNMDWWRQRPTIVRDLLGSVPLLVAFWVTEHLYGDSESLWRAVGVVAVMGVALAVRRRWPWCTFVTALLTVVIATTGLVFLAIASYTVITAAARARPVVVAALTALAASVGFWRWWPTYAMEAIAEDLMMIAVVSVLPVMLGHAVRRGRAHMVELEARNAELVQLREHAAQHALEVERLRIARELHDVVAHHVSAITVRARAANHVARRHPDAAAEALTYIATAGTETLTAMRGFVGSLRNQGKGEPNQLAPQPGLAELEQLLESFRATGLVVHAHLDSVPRTFTPALGLHTYRIVQEALTNVIRHSAAERAWVDIWSAEGTLHIQVDDNGRGFCEADHATGHGLIGIAERTAMHDGSSSLRPSPRGGCRLEAALVSAPGVQSGSRAPDELAIR